MKRARLSPGCMIAWACTMTGALDRELSIEQLRAIIEGAPTYPEAWTYQEGRDFLLMHLGASCAL